VFLADLIRQIDLPQQVGFLEITHSPKSEFLTEILFSSSFRVEGTNLLVVEDILDTGITLAYLCQQLESKKPKSIRVCTLLDKPQKRKVDIQPDYLGFTVPNRHVVGYGLDHEGRFRNLPYLTYVE
jgi:hypoxanthine phosphoribosyltransferase